MMSPDQLAAYGLSEDFAQHNLVVRSGNRRTASPATDGNDVIDSRIPFDWIEGGDGETSSFTAQNHLKSPSLPTLPPKTATRSILRV